LRPPGSTAICTGTAAQARRSTLDRVASTHAFFVRAYWGAAALLLVLLTLKLANRGVPEQLGTKLTRAARQFGFWDVLLFLAVAAAMMLIGSALLFSSDATGSMSAA
jgi:hypothetical protein